MFAVEKINRGNFENLFLKMSNPDKSSVPEKSKTGKKIHFFCDDKFFDENLGVVKIEHCLECPVYAEKALEIYKLLTGKFPKYKFKLLLNESELDGKKIEPRSGAFEVSFAKNCRHTYHLIWSGLEKGPPRRDKFPPQEIEDLARKVQKILVTG